LARKQTGYNNKLIKNSQPKITHAHAHKYLKYNTCVKIVQQLNAYVLNNSIGDEKGYS